MFKKIGLSIVSLVLVSYTAGCDLVVAIAEGSSGFDLSACRGSGFSVCASLVWDNLDKLGL